MNSPIIRTKLLHLILSLVCAGGLLSATVGTALAGSPDQEASPTPTPGYSQVTPSVGTDTVVTSTPPAFNGKAYMRFSLHEQVVRNFAGTMTVSGNGFSQTAPVAVKAGAYVNDYIILPEHMGTYHLEVTESGTSTPALWVHGELARVKEGVYTHRIVGADGNPAVFALTPGEAGITLDIGLVIGYLESCVTSTAPLSGTFRLGLDVNANGDIEPSEVVTTALGQQPTSCIQTPEASIPLTAKYLSEVLGPDGKRVGYNVGVYDFINKTGVSTDKSAPLPIIDFTLAVTRTPLATSVRISNEAIRAPQLTAQVLPQTQERTVDSLHNDVATPTPTATPVVTVTPAQTSTPTLMPTETATASAPESPEPTTPSPLLRYWPLFIIGVASLVFVARSGLLAQRHGGKGRE